MLFALSFTARPGAEAELERILADEGLSRLAAERMGATLDAMFVQGNRFTQVFEFPPGTDAQAARTRILAVHQAEEFRAMLRRAAPLLSNPFDADDPSAFAAFVQRHKLRVVAEAHAAPGGPKTSFQRLPMGASPR